MATRHCPKTSMPALAPAIKRDFPGRRWALVILAGGRSERMGTPKGLLPVDGRSFLQWQCERLRLIDPMMRPQLVVIVLGFGAEAYFEALPILRTALAGPCHCFEVTLFTAMNLLPEAGPFASLTAGLNATFAVNSTWDAIGVLPIDVPISPSVVDALVSHPPPASGAATPSCEGKGGHPVLLGPDFARALCKLAPGEPSARLDRLLGQLGPKQRRYVSVEGPDLRVNINTPEEWATFAGSLGRTPRENSDTL